MKRHEIIWALRKWAHPSWFHDLLAVEDTPALAALLAYYELGGKDAQMSALAKTVEIA